MTTNGEPKFEDFLSAEILANLRDIQSRFVRMEDAIGKTIALADCDGILFEDGTWYSRHGKPRFSEHDQTWRFPKNLGIITDDDYNRWDKALTDFWAAKNRFDNEQHAIELLSDSANYVVIRKGETDDSLDRPTEGGDGQHDVRGLVGKLLSGRLHGADATVRWVSR